MTTPIPVTSPAPAPTPVAAAPTPTPVLNWRGKAKAWGIYLISVKWIPLLFAVPLIILLALTWVGNLSTDTPPDESEAVISEASPTEVAPEQDTVAITNENAVNRQVEQSTWSIKNFDWLRIASIVLILVIIVALIWQLRKNWLINLLFLLVAAYFAAILLFPIVWREVPTTIRAPVESAAATGLEAVNSVNIFAPARVTPPVPVIWDTRPRYTTHRGFDEIGTIKSANGAEFILNFPNCHLVADAIGIPDDGDILMMVPMGHEEDPWSIIRVDPIWPDWDPNQPVQIKVECS